MMRTRRPRAIPFVAATLAVALASGCSGSTDGEQDQANAKPASSAPPPTGVGPYPTPSDVDTSPTPAREPSKAPAQPHGGIPSPESVDQRDAAAVSKGALTAMLTYDTATDASRTEASRRMVAAGWCTAAYGAKAKAGGSQSASGASWTTWTSHRAYTTVDLTSADQAGRPADTETTAFRQWAVVITPHGRDKWIGPPENYTAFVELVRSGKGASWRLNSLSLQ
uniref:Lipoprotein n=2 Tax=Streptomyces sp. NBC_00148 TaxID=2903626 RepID=A0AAU1M585_9ACTN